MSETSDGTYILKTTEGDFTLDDYRLRAGGREWTVLNTGTILTLADEQKFFRELRDRLPYGVGLWPSSIALAHEIFTRAEDFRGARVLELGSGTGLPGIVAASLGANVVQTDRQNLAMSICKRNGERNNITSITYRLADWSDWQDTERYDFIIGSDIMYGALMQPHLRHIFETNLAPGGQVLIADPYREVSFLFLEELDAVGWDITFTRWQIGMNDELRNIGIFELMARA